MGAACPQVWAEKVHKGGVGAHREGLPRALCEVLDREWEKVGKCPSGRPMCLSVYLFVCLSEKLSE